jgi:hypothetical protein
MKALIISLESFQRGEVPEEVKKYVLAHHGNIFTILDESSKIKTNEPCKESKKSKRTQAVMKLNRIGQRCILTGTFMSKSPVNAYDQMNFLKDGFFPEGMYAFAEHYVIRRALPSVRGARITITQKDYEAIYKRLSKCRDNPNVLCGAMDSVHSFYGIGREDCVHIMNHKEYTPFKNIDELWNRIGDNCVHPKKEDILDVPPKIYENYKLELTKEQRDLYLQLQNQHCTDHITVDNGLKLYLRFQDICNGYEPVETDELDKNGNPKVELVPLKENPKLDWLEEYIESLGNEQCLVWCSRSRLLHDACSRMRDKGYTCGIYDGKVGTENRERDYEDFYNGKIQILFLNQASGGYGLDKLRNANYGIYLCNDASVEKRQQSEDRCCRGLYTESKFMVDVSMEHTVEQRVTEALKQGKELVDSGITDASLFLLEE